MHSLMWCIYHELVEKHGGCNVTIMPDETLKVFDEHDGKEHTVSLETVK